MAQPPVEERARIAKRIGIPEERIRLARSPMEVEPRDLVLLPGGADPPHPTVLALHGMGMRIEPFLRWLSDLRGEPWAWWVPEGPFPLERRVGGLRMIGYAWYVWEDPSDRFRDSLARSRERLVRLLDQRAREHRLDPDRVIALGFSQGGYFGASLALRHAERFLGLAVAGGRVRIAFADRPIESIPRIPILFLHGRDDDLVPAAEARRSAEELRDLGFPVTWVEVDGGHIWNGAMSEAFRVWARGLFDRHR